MESHDDDPAMMIEEPPKKEEEASSPSEEAPVAGTSDEKETSKEKTTTTSSKEEDASELLEKFLEFDVVEDVSDDEGAPRTEHEMELPPPESLEGLEVDATSPLEHVGVVWSAVDDCVVIKGQENAKALVEGVVLCRDDRSPMGRVFEIFGPVAQPHYILRVGLSRGETVITKGDLAFVAKSQAAFVDAAYVSSKRGCDASDLHDEELPEDQLDSSDDEDKVHKRNKRKNAPFDDDDDAPFDDDDDDAPQDYYQGDNNYLLPEDNSRGLSTAPAPPGAA